MSGAKVDYSATLANGIAAESAGASAGVTIGCIADMQGFRPVGEDRSLLADVAYHFRMFDNNNVERWNNIVHGTVVTAGLDWLADAFRDGVAAPNWYILLVDGTTTPVFSPGDTMASHGGWAEESADYSQATRPALTLGATTAGVTDNSASLAQFSFTGAGAIAGAGVTSTNNKGGGTGTLYDVGLFPDGYRSYGNGWNLYLSVTWSVTAA